MLRNIFNTKSLVGRSLMAVLLFQFASVVSAQSSSVPAKAPVAIAGTIRSGEYYSLYFGGLYLGGEATCEGVDIPSGKKTDILVNTPVQLGIYTADCTELSDIKIKSCNRLFIKKVVENPFQIEWDTRFANKQKEGFPEYGTASNPPKRYLKRTMGGFASVPDCYCGSNHTVTYNYSGVAEKDPADGHYITYGTMNINRPGCPDGNETPYSITDASTYPWCYCYRSLVALSSISAKWVPNSGGACENAAGEGTESLSVEHTTASFKTLTENNLGAYTGTWTEDMWGELDSHAILSPDQLNYNIRESRYRIRYKPTDLPDGTTTLKWVERFIPVAGVPITSIEVVDGGYGYTSAPTVYISSPGGSGTPAVATASIENGRVKTITLTAGGSGYTLAPYISLEGGGGAGAAILPHLGTETPRQSTVSGIPSPGYDPNDPSTRPIIPASSYYQLSIPSDYGTVTIANLHIPPVKWQRVNLAAPYQLRASSGTWLLMAMPGTSAPGAGDPDATLGSVDFKLDIGQAPEGYSYGQLRLHSDAINSATSLRAQWSIDSTMISMDEVEQITNAGGLRQIVSASGLIDLQDASGGCDIRFYTTADHDPLNGGLYPIKSGAVPYVTYEVRDATAASVAKLLIKELRPSATGKYHLYGQQTGDVWSLEQGTLGSGSTLVPTNRTTRSPITIEDKPAYSFVEEDFTYNPGPRTTTRRAFTNDAVEPYKSRDQSIDQPEGSRITYDYTKGYYNSSTGVFTPYTWGSDLLTTETLGRALVSPEFWTGRSTRTATVTKSDGTTLERTLAVYNGTGFTDVEQTRYSYDEQGNLLAQTRNGQTIYSAQWTDGFKDWEIDETGVKIAYSPWPDGTYVTASGKQPVKTKTKTAVGSYASYPAQPAVTTTYYYSPDGNGDVYVSAEETSGGGLTLQAAFTQDNEGRLTFSETNGLHTSYAYETLTGGGLRTTITQPSGATEIREEGANGHILRVSGTGVTAEYHTYTQDVDGHDVHTTYYGSSTAATANYLALVTDSSGRRLRELRPAYLTATTAGVNQRDFYYDATGQLVKETATGIADKLYVYNDLGELWRSGYDMNGDGQLTLSSTDKLQQTETTYQQDGSDWYRVSSVQIPYTLNSATLTTVSQTKERLTLPTGTLSETISIDEAGVQTHKTSTVNLAEALVEESTTVSGATGTNLRVARNGLLQAEQANAQTSPTLYSYDGLGRLGTITPAAGPLTVYGYNTDGLLESTTRHSSDNTQTWVESLTYHAQGAPGAGQVATRTTAGQVTHYAYDLSGYVLRQWGASYPVRFTYDTFGRMETLRTYRTVGFDLSGASWPAGDTTTWAYHPATGQLISKTDAAGQPVSYAYWPSGAVKTRAWARGLVTTYGYTDARELASIAYSDDTPAVGITYDRGGRPLATTDAAGTLTRSYESGVLKDELYTGTGLLSGRTIQRVLGTYGRQSSLTTDAGYSLGYTYDAVGRLDELTQGNHLAKYGYKANVGTVETVTIKRQGVERAINEYELDGLGRLETVRMTTGSVVPVERGYHYNAANQRDRITHEDTRLWSYGYDGLGQVNAAQKRLADNVTSLPGYSFGYDFDQIGNRSTTTVSGRTATYTPNQLNQIESRQVPEAVDVRGEALAGATVTVDAQSTTRTGRDYYREVALTNGTTATKARLSIAATDGTQTVTETRLAFLQQTPEALEYDLDGNLKKDGRWDYTWDAENRLVKMETRSTVVSASGISRERLTFAYDSKGRRIRKLVELFNPTTSLWVQTADTKFIYDGWNLLAEHRWNPITSTYVLNVSYAWGLDLSGTLQGAGGVGGLLWANLDTQTFAASADANGNVVAYVNTDTQAVAGRLDYSAFGEPVVKTGVAGIMPYGFSSKYTDAETGLAYYGYRYYDTSIGRWLNKDPLGVRGGFNLYGILGNGVPGKVDYLGLVEPALASGALVSAGSRLIGPYVSGDLAAVLWLFYGGGGDYELSESSVRSFSFLPELDFYDFNAAVTKFEEAKTASKWGFRVLETDNAVNYGYVRNPLKPDYIASDHLLGHFAIRIKGSGGKKMDERGDCHWYFKGSFRIEDTFRFDPVLGPSSSGAAPYLNKAGQISADISASLSMGEVVPGPVYIKSTWINFKQKITARGFTAEW